MKDERRHWQPITGLALAQEGERERERKERVRKRIVNLWQRKSFNERVLIERSLGYVRIVHDQC